MISEKFEKVLSHITIMFCFLSFSQTSYAKPLPREVRMEFLKILHDNRNLSDNTKFLILKLGEHEKNFQLDKSEKLALAISLTNLTFKDLRTKKAQSGGYEDEIIHLIKEYSRQREIKNQLKALKSEKERLLQTLENRRSVSEAMVTQAKATSGSALSLWDSLEPELETKDSSSEYFINKTLEIEQQLKSINETLQQRSCQADISLLKEAKTLAKSNSQTSFSKLEAQAVSKKAQENQINTSFENKFKAITSDIRETSKQNLLRLEEALMQRPHFEEFLQLAKEHISGINQSFVVTHEAPAKAAIEILRSGMILSTDELIRAGLKSPKDINNGMTFSYIDGLIGEQDTVFFSMRPKDTEKPRLFDGQIGRVASDVTFVLDKDQALQKSDSYFTPFAFGMAGDRPEREEEGYEYLKVNGPLYKQMIFQSKEAFNKFLLLSIADTLRFEASDHSVPIHSIREALKSVESFPKENRIMGFDFPKSLHLNWPELSDIFKAYGFDLEYLKNQKPSSIYSMQNYFENRFKSKDSPTKFLSAFQGFPVEKGIFPPIFACGHDFWELKIPRKVSLDLVSEIHVRIGVKQEDEIKQMILEYASTAGKRVEEGVQGNEKIYKLKSAE